jgi:hypothetical protein
MKTAMQEMIEYVKEVWGWDQDFEIEAKELLEKEKKQIEQAFRKGGDFRSFGGNPDYYNETYKN